jgi:amino acid adenylation domain-containing protein
MQQEFTTFLQDTASDSQQSISNLSHLTDKECHQLLVEWNATHVEYPMDRCIHQLFEDQVECTPDVVAVSFQDEHLTYRELNSKANQLAYLLQQEGVGPEMLVGGGVERSLDMVIGLLGVLKAGGAYVPLDPTYPSERIAFMLEDAQVQALVTQQHLLAQLPVQRTKVVCLDTYVPAHTRQSQADPLSGVTSDNLAYVIYTSGSTGQPKGVQIMHRAVVNFLLSMREHLGFTSQDRLLAITTISFDIAALELFLSLIVGAHVIVISRETAADGAALAEILAGADITVMQATPITWHLLLASGWQGKPDLRILCGGEALPLDLAQMLLPRTASLWNLYGPTETTIWSTICKIEPEDEVVTIGRPIANTQIYLLDPRLQPVSVGEPGELYIGGDGLARGYLNRPELTDERFITHPFSNKPGAHIYKTGDLARYQPDGTIVHLGRLDHQIKLRGLRIELGEIETALARYPAVRQAVVVAHEDASGDKRLVAYLVLHEQQTTTISDLQSHAARLLPNYMVPSAFILLEAFPLTPNGKVDRCALPAPHFTPATQQQTFASPRTSIEKVVAGIWSQILGIARIGINDDFFELGGDSLKVLLVIARLRQSLQIQLSLARFYEARTVALLSQIIEPIKANNAQQELPSALPTQEGGSSRGENDGSVSEYGASATQRQEEKGSRTTIVPVQTGGSKQPFFFLHGDFLKGAFYCFPLARHLGLDQPFYALEPYNFDGLEVPPTLEVIAAAHLEALRSIQPEGPYLLGGFCNGALVAYEMAWQLHAQEETVDLLILIDPDLVGHCRQTRRIINRLGKLLRLSESKQLYWFLWQQHMYKYLQHVYRYLRFPHYRRWATELVLQKVDPKGGIILALGELHAHKLELAAEHLDTDEQIDPVNADNRVDFALPKLNTIFPEPLFPTTEVLHQDYEFMFFWATSQYMPDLYAGKSTFFFTHGSEEQGLDAKWRKVALAKDEEVEVHHIAGWHNTCKTIHLQDLTRHLHMCLNRAQGERGARTPYVCSPTSKGNMKQDF